MSDLCTEHTCHYRAGGICMRLRGCYHGKAHKPAPNEGGSVGSSDLLVACEAPTACPETTVHSSPLVARADCNHKSDGDYYFACKKCLAICYTLEHLASHHCQGK